METANVGSWKVLAAFGVRRFLFKILLLSNAGDLTNQRTPEASPREICLPGSSRTKSLLLFEVASVCYHLIL